MLRTVIAITAGYFSITALNSFVHLIISIYFKTEVTLTGVAFLPSTTWTVGVTALQFAFGLFGGLLATTIAQNSSKVILGFILIMVAVGLINYSMTAETEPLWYLILAPLLTISGIYLGHRLQTQNTSSQHE